MAFIAVLLAQALRRGSLNLKALVAHPGPCYLRVDKSAAGLPPVAREDFRFGKGRIVREGDDVALVAVGGIVAEAVKAAEMLAEKGISAHVLELHTLKPLDGEAIANAVRGTKGMITIEEHNIIGGLAGAVSEYCMEAGLQPGFFRRVGLKDTYSSIVGSQDYLRNHYAMNAEAIMSLACEALEPQ